MRKSSKVLLSALLLIGLAGCGTDNNDNDNNLQTNRVRTNNVDNQQLRVSGKASRAVERLDEVDRAQVIISKDNNAYVAVRLDDNNAGTDGNRNNDNNNNNLLENGKVNPNGNNGRIDGKGDAGNKAGALGNRNNSGDRNLDGNDNGMANGLGLGNGTDLGNGNNNGLNNDNNNNNNLGGNGVIREQNYTGVSTPLDQRIADQVRKADSKIHKVYISYNEDFYNTMNGYTNDLNNGRNGNGMWNDFTGTVNGVFGNR